MRISCAPILLLATAFAFGQSPFVGMWQTSTTRGSNKPAITVVVVEIEKRLGGAVVLVNPAVLNWMVLANTPRDRVSGRDSLVSGRHGAYVGWSWRGNRSS